jgi:hypothetical protein
MAENMLHEPHPLSAAVAVTGNRLLQRFGGKLQ